MEAAAAEAAAAVASATVSVPLRTVSRSILRVVMVAAVDATVGPGRGTLVADSRSEEIKREGGDRGESVGALAD